MKKHWPPSESSQVEILEQFCQQTALLMTKRNVFSICSADTITAKKEQEENKIFFSFVFGFLPSLLFFVLKKNSLWVPTHPPSFSKSRKFALKRTETKSSMLLISGVRET